MVEENEPVKISSGSTIVDFSEVLKAVDGEPLMDVDRNNQEVPVTLGRVLGNVLANFRPEVNPQRGGVDIEKFDSMRAVDLGLKIYKSKPTELTAGDLDFLIEYISHIPFSRPIVQYRINTTLKSARVNIK